MKDTILNILNQPVVVTFIVTGFAWLIAKLFTAKPEWIKYEGFMISAVKFAEKEIPDGTINAGLARADAALKAFIAAYERQYKAHPTQKLVDAVKLNMPLIHQMLESEGAL